MDRTPQRRPPPDGSSGAAAERVPCTRVGAAGASSGEAALVIEAPLEIRILGQPVATVMRTPGDDRDLALGFLFSEGWIRNAGDVGSLCLGAWTAAAGEAGASSGGAAPAEQLGAVTVADLRPAPECGVRLAPPPRAGAVVASCGVCGKVSIEDVLAALPPLSPAAATDPAAAPACGDRLRVPPQRVAGIVRELRRRQPTFDLTGGLHAAGLFDAGGAPVVVREDIGRHNAVDKALGAALQSGAPAPWAPILAVSGRASFEIIQKALRGGVRVVVAVSGVSDLARRLADRGGITLCGFARGDAFTVYTHPARTERGGAPEA